MHGHKANARMWARTLESPDHRGTALARRAKCKACAAACKAAGPHHSASSPALSRRRGWPPSCYIRARTHQTALLPHTVPPHHPPRSKCACTCPLSRDPAATCRLPLPLHAHPLPTSGRGGGDGGRHGPGLTDAISRLRQRVQRLKPPALDGCRRGLAGACGGPAGRDWADAGTSVAMLRAGAFAPGCVSQSWGGLARAGRRRYGGQVHAAPELVHQGTGTCTQTSCSALPL